MKKIFSILGIVLFAGSILLSSCSSNRLCPAYPPSVYAGGIDQNSDQLNNIETIEIEKDKL